jgi:signal transduction histidine kinase
MFKARIAAFGAAIMAAICALVIEAVISERNAALERASVEAANLAAGFAGQVRGTFTGVAAESEFIKGRIEAEGAAFDLKEWKKRLPELRTPAIQIVIINAEGKVSATTLDRDGSQTYLAERDFFIAHRDNPNLGLFIGEPVFGKITKRVVIPATRRLETKDGQFAGVVSFSLDVELLITLHQNVDLGKTGAIALARSDGMLLARYTSSKGVDLLNVGQEVEAAKDWRGENSPPAGQFTEKCQFDGVTRISSWRKVGGYPLIALAGLGEAEALLPATRQAQIVIGLGIAALSLPLIMMIILNGEITRRVEHSIALDDQSEKVRKEHAALLSITEELAAERIKLRKANSQLMLATRRSEEANMAKSAFLANMSHELRTPLNAILGFSEMIRDKLMGNDADRYASYAADIHQSGAHLLHIVNDILDVTKIEAGKLELREENVKFEQIVLEALVAVEQQATVGGVYLKSVLFCLDLGTFIYGDKTKLTQILINLLSNAIKFTPAGGTVDISAAAAPDGGLNLTVGDTGIGMSNEEVEQALELFRQVDNCLSRRFEGAGLGLPLAVQLTELHGGTLTIESTPGTGTTVVVHFPADRIARDPGKGAKQKSAEPARPFKIAS